MKLEDFYTYQEQTFDSFMGKVMSTGPAHNSRNIHTGLKNHSKNRIDS